jgi:diguanylate cyclase (GGDEF)-like protein
VTTPRTSNPLFPVLVPAVALAMVAVIGWADYLTGTVAMSLFYFVPIVITAWHSGWMPGLVVALGAGASWIMAEIAHAQDPPNIITWNGFTRTSTFVILAVMVRLVRQDRDQLNTLNARLQRALEIESRMARTDLLTGLPNSRSFSESLARELARGQRENGALGLGYVDLDSFKTINDTLGHDVGDEVLRRVGDALRRCVRAEDMAARLGGDEFVILSVRPTKEGLESIGRRLVEEVREIARDYPGTGFGCTIGFVLFPHAPDDPVAAVREADELMYEVKDRAKGSFELRVSG